METELDKRPHGKITFIILLSLISVFIIYYSVMSVMSPARKLQELKNEFATKTTGGKAPDAKILMDSAYLKLLKEKSFLQSRVLMAQTDSIYLTINLADSSVNLEISGVVVHKAKISSLKTSKVLMRGNDFTILSLLGTPLTISSSIATIKKEPLMIKMAPKDTSEYKPDIMPDTSLTEPVNYILEVTGGMKIYIYQVENLKFNDRISQLKFDITDRFRETWSALKRIAVFKIPDYHPFIKIKIPRTDAKIIYRAIPKNGQIAVFN